MPLLVVVAAAVAAAAVVAAVAAAVVALAPVEAGKRFFLSEARVRVAIGDVEVWGRRETGSVIMASPTVYRKMHHFNCLSFLLLSHLYLGGRCRRAKLPNFVWGVLLFDD